jgi:hypothetical protein
MSGTVRYCVLIKRGVLGMGPHQVRYQEALAKMAAGRKINSDELQRLSSQASQEAKYEQEDFVRAMRGQEPLVGQLRRPQSQSRSSLLSSTDL